MKTAAAFTHIFFLLFLSFSCAEAASFTNMSTHYLAPFTPKAAAIADFNGDGNTDAAITISDAGNGYVRIFLGDGTGTLTPLVADLPTGSIAQSDPRGIVAADLNRDGKIDLAVANFSDDSVSVFLNDGSGTFTRTDYPLGTGTGPIAIAVGDFRGDGIRDDLAVLNSTGNSVAVMINNGAGGMTVQNVSTWPVTTGVPVAIVVGDFNGDDVDDIAATPNSLGHVTVFRGNGLGTFSAGSDIAAGTGPKALVAADFNNDGIMDLAVLNGTDATISVVKGARSGILIAGTPINVAIPVDLTANPAAIVAVDLNRDGILDLAVANSSKNSVSVLTGYGDATFTPADSLNTFSTGTGPTGLASGDLNGSGNDLISISGAPDNSYSVLFNSSPVAAGLTVLPGAYDFGNFVVGHQAYMDKLLTLFNGGSAPLIISSAVITGNTDFQALPQGCTTTTPTIDPGNSCTILAKFLDPINAVTESANLTFASNATSVPSVIVPLSGTGTLTSYTVKVSFIGRGSGSVSTNYFSGAQTAPFTFNPPENVTVQLNESPDSGSYLYGWTGCDSVAGNSCIISMSTTLALASDRNLSVNFGVVPRSVMLAQTPEVYAKTVAEAYNAAAASGIIKTVSGLFAEDLYLGKASDVQIHGGYDGSFTAQSATLPTQLRSITIAAGSAVLDNIVLQ